MVSVVLQSFAQCRTFTELAQAIVDARLFSHDFSACLIAEVGKDGHIREAGRFGITGPGPSSEAVPLSDGGLIAQAAKKRTPTVLLNVLDAARARSLTPSSDIDDLMVDNGFTTIVVMPLRSAGLLKAVVGLASVAEPASEVELAHDYTELQALLTLATRSVAYSQSLVNDAFAPMLTSREQAIVALIAGWFTNKEIGAELNLSLATVKLSISGLFAKLGVSTRMQAADRAIELGIIA